MTDKKLGPDLRVESLLGAGGWQMPTSSQHSLSDQKTMRNNGHSEGVLLPTSPGKWAMIGTHHVTSGRFCLPVVTKTPHDATLPRNVIKLIFLMYV